MSFFASRRFLPLFVTQFLGAFNDNLLKNSLVMLITYRLASGQDGDAQLLVTAAAGLFILPFFLFSATAGQIADKIDRAKITRVIKFVEIIIMLAAAIGFYTSSVWFLMTVLFMMGVHSTFFGPIKFALLPQHLKDDELLLGNAYIEAGTFLAILFGTILGGILILHQQGVALVSFALLLVAVAGYISSRYIPVSPAPEPSLIIKKNIWKETWHIVGFARENKRVFLCIIGISWFWLVGATYLSQFPTYAKDVLHTMPEVVTLFLTVFSVGIGIGSFLCNKLLKGIITSKYVPISMLGMTIFGIDLYFASIYNSSLIHPSMLMDCINFDCGKEGIGEFVSSLNNLRILFDLLLIAICAGLYIVPLYAIMQHDSSAQHRARIIAANNVVNAIFMVAAALITLALLSLHFTIPQVFLFMAVANGLVAVYIWRLLPRVRAGQHD
jgi:acyl-[acyl-carrier-protein]-phospholipid O-acyltransferase/long-chain-fatty-acid--[acyl-carrier-protein] ligase